MITKEEYEELSGWLYTWREARADRGVTVAQQPGGLIHVFAFSMVEGCSLAQFRVHSGEPGDFVTNVKHGVQELP